MTSTLDFPDLLRLIDERASAFRAAVAAAPSLDAAVPTCPGWTLFDLVEHLGNGRRKWAAIIAAGPADAPPAPPFGPAAPREREALLEWFTVSAQELLAALREAGPDRGCWAWWEGSQSPLTAGGAARHQVQEMAVHTYDAQLTGGAPQPLPDEVAFDGVEEFQVTCVATTSPWPHEPAVVDYHATDDRSWRQWLSADGARVAELTAGEDGEGPGPAGASVRATASDVVLLFYGRVSLDDVKIEGDRRILQQLIDWDPS